ncbi:hypothetical protein PCK2_000054 [Pneumocystis canis]|nr:hypothetical protein PCK2_000054 [Pneumocystis canis]
MLGGGIQSMSITEFRCGKTQISHTMCVTCQLPREMGGAEGKAAYLDTEGTFRPDRIKSIAARFGVDAEQAMNNILVGRAFNSEHQMDLINKMCTIFSEDGRYRLLIVDSIMALFRVDYSGRGELSERQQKLNVMLSRLNRISEEYNIAVQADPGATLMFASNDRKPVGGHVLAHAYLTHRLSVLMHLPIRRSATRILLRKGRGEERVAKIQDSPDMRRSCIIAEAECVYTIKAGGIDDS